MSRPTTKEMLLSASQESYETMMSLSLKLKHPQQNFSFIVTDKMTQVHWLRDKNLRDVLIHLHEWHLLVLHWIKANQAGQAASFFPTPYNWRTYGGLNQEFVLKHQETSLEQAKVLLAGSHKDMLELIETFSDEALFTKQYFTWTGTTTLGSYFVSSLPSHYDWAIKKMKYQLKADKSIG
ncbi:ClbS/DfsB family four-helix bundle protein [Pseudolactococcus plantarum]|nr:ClbS/DfsB family four-helix bundle protein [Lactococcus plantarum]HCN73922.1 ClbS/DfsB family four-helix bundle protein [Lactococcus sp.]